MRKLIAFLVLLSIVLPGVFLPAYARDIHILASFYPVYIMAKNVTRDVPGVHLTNLAPTAGGCLHDYTLSTQDMRKLARADILLANGAGIESYLERVAGQYPGLKVVKLSEGIDLIADASGHEDNPHVWVSISDAITQVKNLGMALAALDPQNQELYEKNTRVYAGRLEELRLKMHAELDRYQGRPIITFHEAFPYFAREFGLDIVAVVEREPGSRPGAGELAQTIRIVRNNNLPAIFTEPQYPDAAAQVIARETGAKIYQLDPAVTGPDEYDAYINIMENNLRVLKSALHRSQ